MFKAGETERGEVYIELWSGGRYYCPPYLLDVDMQITEAEKLVDLLKAARKRYEVM